MCKIMGIDPSIRSTGICIHNSDTKKCLQNKYYLIVAQPTKKVLEFQNKNIGIIPYNYVSKQNIAISCGNQENSTKQIYQTSEFTKSQNVYSILQNIKAIIKKEKPTLINIEGIALAAIGKIDALSGLNYGIRNICIELEIPFQIISPSANKKSFTGLGNAKKDLMVSSWCNLEQSSQFPDLDKTTQTLGKHCEDLADACALSLYINSI